MVKACLTDQPNHTLFHVKCRLITSTSLDGGIFPITYCLVNYPALKGGASPSAPFTPAS